MTWQPLLLGFAAGCLSGALVSVAAHAARSSTADIPRAGILHGWTVVRDDETLLCESPSIFAPARQIECP